VVRHVVRAWFTPLNSHAAKAPLHGFANSAKRYALSNLDPQGRPIIRKASAHGLGHLIAPYTNASALDLTAPSLPLAAIGVERWQHDVWHRNPHSRPRRPSGCSASTARRSAATPSLLRWFKTFNHGKHYRQQVRPLGFLLAFQARHAANPAPAIVRSPPTPRRRPTATAPRRNSTTAITSITVAPSAGIYAPSRSP